MSFTCGSAPVQPNCVHALQACHIHMERGQALTGVEISITMRSPSHSADCKPGAVQATSHAPRRAITVFDSISEPALGKTGRHQTRFQVQ